MSLRKQWIQTIIPLLCFTLLLGGCTKVGETSSDLPSESSVSSFVPSSEPEPEPEPTGIRNPLTGEDDFPETAVGKRPVTVMVNNIGAALPQLGLGDADIIYEVVVEGGITRLMAVFADPDAIPYVGPVRSVRHYYVAFARPYNPIFVHFGGSPAGYSYLSNLSVNNVDGMKHTGAFYQDKQRAASKGKEHSYFINSEGISSIAGKQGYKLEGEWISPFTFAKETVALGNSDGDSIFVKFSGSYNAQFDYQADTGLYEKQRNGADHIDGNTGDILTFTNLIVLSTDIGSYNGEAERRDVKLTGGDGYYATAGGQIPIKWTKGKSEQPFVFTKTDGTPLELNTGKSYICIVAK